MQLIPFHPTCPLEHHCRQRQSFCRAQSLNVHTFDFDPWLYSVTVDKMFSLSFYVCEVDLIPSCWYCYNQFAKHMVSKPLINNSNHFVSP